MGTTLFTQAQLAEAPGGGGAVFEFFASSLNTTTVTRFLKSAAAASAGSGVAQTTPSITSFPLAVGTLQNLIIKHDSVGVGGAITYTVLVNGTPSDLIVTINASDTGGNSTTGTGSLVFGDELSVRITKGSSIGSSPDDVTANIGVT